MADELPVSFQEDTLTVGDYVYPLPEPPITSVGLLLAFIEQQVRFRAVVSCARRILGDIYTISIASKISGLDLDVKRFQI